ncbi:alpha/beta hydrolase, partial [Escherichia marmotae]|nr:alpha/beta hydrolase [Escherichia marmotae]
LFLHGTPGDWKAWAHFMADPELQKRATMISVDRAGFGASDPGRVAPLMADQARLLAPLLEGPGGPTLLVGHSLGGPIGAELAMR